MRTVIVVGLLLPLAAMAQSFNADFDIFGGGPIVGDGAPSDDFGAAANHPGRWNRVNPSGGPKQLVGLDGALTNVWLTRTGNSQAGGWNNPLNSGDFRLLLNDAGDIGSQTVSWTFTGLQSGAYRLFVYAVNPVPGRPAYPTEVYVPGSTSTNPQLVTGPMPGNSFQHLVTHSIHDIIVLDGELSFAVTRLHPQFISKVNGFQLVAVPEPISAVSLTAGFVILVLRRKAGSLD